MIDDARIRLWLSGHHEMLLALDGFVTTYALDDKPALIVQARRVDGENVPALDLEDEATLARFKNGSGARNGWWDGLQSGQKRFTFSGVAFQSHVQPPKWAIEMHPAHHFIAAAMTFPDLNDSGGKAVVCISDFYATFFPDVLSRVASQHDVSDAAAPTYDVTATLLNAAKLHFAAKSDWGNSWSVTAKPLTLRHLQWPVRRAVVGTPEWDALAKAMGRGLTGAYGASTYKAT